MATAPGGQRLLSSAALMRSMSARTDRRDWCSSVWSLASGRTWSSRLIIRVCTSLGLAPGSMRP